MTNVELQMTKEIRKSNDECTELSGFDIRHSFDI